MSTIEPIRMLGRYELLRRIAKGGMGEIYLARTRGTAGFEKTCIIKTILPHLADEEEFLTKFLDEGHIVVQLVHGNIVPVFDMGDEDGEVYIAMEYIPGRDLREVTKRLAARAETMPVDLALFVASEVCKGLDYAHRKTGEDGASLEIVHRDVSPSNVLISREGEVKLIDFGIARATGKLGKTISGRIQGKFCYMSPEQAAGKPLDGRSDIFSAGVVLYELLTGFRPFEGGTDLESLDLVRQCEFDPPSTLNADVPDEIDELVAKALAKDPADRYQTIDKFQIAVLQYLYSTGTSPTSSDLAVFLGELFPEGLEREELRSARDGSGSPAKKMSLDEALDFELGRLGEDGATMDVDPHETTAVSSEEVRLRSGSAEHTRTRSAPPITPAETLAETPTASVAPRSRAWMVPALLLCLVAIAGVAYGLLTSSAGTRTIDSTPPGAQISVDGLLIPGAVTPYTLKLDEGEHTVTLELDGYETTRLSIDVESGTREQVPTTRLKAKVVQKGPRTFELRTDPPNAELRRDGAVLASRLLTLMPGEVATIVASAEGCDNLSKQVEYGYGNTALNFELDCDAEVADAGTSESELAAEKTITIKSAPPGAQIEVNGKALGTAPVTWTGPASTLLRVTAKKGELATSMKRPASRIRGALTLRLEAKAGPPGCLTMSIIRPPLAQWFVDGHLVDEKMGIKNHRVAAGTHTVQAVNKVEKINHTERVTVKPGDDCTEVLLDGTGLK